MSDMDPTLELGLVHDKQLICSCGGFLQQNNSTRDLCNRFISKGDKFYDLISRYDDVTAYVLNRPEVRSGNTTKFVTPFLKAFGITDFKALEHSREKMNLMPEAERVMSYFMNMLPTFITTTAYEHNMMNVCDAIDMPVAIVDCTEINFDSYDMGRQEAKAIREMAGRITSLEFPKQKYELDVPVRLDDNEINMIETLDEIFNEKMKSYFASDMAREFKSVGSNEKAYFLMDLRRRTQIDFDGTAYIGGDITDILALSTIADRGGLALSFNGCDFAVRKSNIAVLSRDCTVAAVLLQEFYNEGIGAVFDLVENWDREKLKKKDFPDPNLMKAMLDSNPKKLPEVHIVDKDNVDEIAKKSDDYRKKILRSY